MANEIFMVNVLWEARHTAFMAAAEEVLLAIGYKTLVFTVCKPFQCKAYERELIRGMLQAMFVEQPNGAIRKNRKA